MAELIVENQICKTCGTDVRPQALFCYNCGGAVGFQPDSNENTNGNKKSGVLPKSNHKEEVRDETANKTAVFEAEREVAQLQVKEETIKKDKKPDVFEEAKLKSAASLRRKAKSVQPKKIEVVWEEPENVSGVRLTLIVILLTTFAAAVVFFAISMK